MLVCILKFNKIEIVIFLQNYLVFPEDTARHGFLRLASQRRQGSHLELDVLYFVI